MAEIKPLNDQDQALLGPGQLAQQAPLLGVSAPVDVPQPQPFTRGSFRPLSEEDQAKVSGAISGQPQPVGSLGQRIIDFAGRNLPKDKSAVNPEKLAAAYGLVADTDPDQEAMDQELARELNVPLWIFKANKANRDQAIEILKQGKGPNYDWEMLSQRAPKLSAFLQRPENMAVAKDDVENLAKTEWFFDSLKRGWKSGNKQLELADIGSKQIFGNTDAALEARAQQLEAEMKAEIGPEGWFPASFFGAAQLAPQLLEQLKAGGKYGAIGGATVAGGAALTGVGLPAAAPAGMAAMTAGMYTGAMETAFKLEAGSAFREFISTKDISGNSIDRDVAKVAAIMVGAANAGIEAFQLKWLMESIPGADKLVAKLSRDSMKEILRNRTYSDAFVNFAKKYAGVVSKETATEILQEGITILGLEGSKKVSGQSFAPVPEGTYTSRLAETGVQSVQAFSILALPGPMGGFIHDSARAAKAQQNMEVIQALGENAAASKTLGRLPSAYQDFIREVKKDGPVENIHISASQFVAYFQDNAPKVAQELGIDQQLAEQLAAGGDLSIPLEVYQAKLAGTEHHAQLAPDIKLREDDMSYRESQEFTKRRQEYYQQELDKAKGILAVQSEETQQANQVAEQIKMQLIAEGRKPEVAAADAQIIAARSMVASKQLGITPVEWFKRKGIIIEKGEALPAGRIPVTSPNFGPVSDRLIAAIAAQESAGDPNVVNQYSGAAGKYQIMPDNWPVWAQEAGVDPADMSEANQDRVAAFKIQQYMKEFGSPELVAAAWYAGPEYARSLQQGKPLYDPNTPQADGHPSVNQYIREVTGRMGGQSFFQYAGVIADTADMLNLARAQELEAQGFDPETIRQNTGWHKGMEGKWRWEINDTDAQFKFNVGQQGMMIENDLGRLLDHPALFAAYPHLAYIPTSITIDQNANSGGRMNIDPINGESFEIRAKSPDHAMRILMHEIQHLIQQEEDFASGGSVELMTEVRKKAEQMQGASALRAWLPQAGANMTPEEQYQKLLADHVAAGLGDIFPDYEAFKLSQNPAVTDDMLQRWEGVHSKMRGKSDLQAYRQLAGEIEARDTMMRLGLTEDGRRVTAPVMDSNAIIHFNGRDFRYDPELRRQLMEQGYTPDMVALHNITPEKLQAAAELGGMPMPSLAITQKDITFENFGRITLIGNSRLLSPASGARVFDADVYSPRVPGKEYPVKNAEVSKAYKKVLPYFREIERTPYELDEYAKRGLEDLMERISHNDDYVYAYLRDTGHKIDPVMRERPLQYGKLAADPKVQAVIKETGDINSGYDYEQNPDKVRQISLAVSDGLKRQIDEIVAKLSDDPASVQAEREYLEKQYARTHFDADGNIHFSVLIQLQQDVKNLGRQEVDQRETQKKAREELAKIPRGAEKFEDWARALIRPMFGEPFLMLGRKKVPYTLENVLEAMRRQQLQGGEKTMAFGPGNARSAAAQRLNSQEQMRDAKGRLISYEAFEKWKEEVQKPAMEEYQNKVLPHYKYSSTWEALDDSMRVLYDYYKGGTKRSESRMRTALRKWDFVNVTDETVAAALDFAEALANAPTQYFEAKVDRGVDLSEFTGAVVPKDLDFRTRKILEDAGLPVVEYDPYVQGSRAAAVQSFYDRPNVLFQEETAFQRWFGDSKVVDEEGRPLVVYHGTLSEFSKFDPARIESEDGFFFTDSPVNAAEYAGYHGGLQSEGGNIMPVYLRITNPYIYTAKEWANGEGLDPVDARSAGYDGAIIKGQDGADTFLAFDPSQIKSAIGNAGAYDPRNLDIYSQAAGKGPRGAITFEPGRVIITLLPRADRSTFVHETGHLFLEDLQDVVLSGRAPAQTLADFEAAKTWLGVTPDQIDARGRVQFTREQHEKFARGWEAYLLEGKAPSVKLQNVFRQFKYWLTRIYRSIKGLNVEITPEVRGLMDRLIATEDEIAEAETIAGYHDLFADEAGKGISLADYNAYLKLQAEARATAEEILLAKQMEELTEEQKARVAEERRRVTPEIWDEVSQQQVYKALAVMQTPEQDGGMKINAADLVKYYGEDILGKLPKNIYSGKAALTADDAADLFGYSSGDELIQAIAAAKPIDQEVQDRIDLHMAQFAAQTGINIKAEAAAAVHNEKRLEALAMERQIVEELTMGGSDLDNRIRAVANKQMQATLAEERQRLMDEHIAYLVRNSALGVERRTMTPDENGDYHFAAGYSNNHPWYADILALTPNGGLPGNWYDFTEAFKAGEKDLAKMPKAMREAYEIVADDHLRNGLQSLDGYVPENETYLAVANMLADVERLAASMPEQAALVMPVAPEQARQLALDLEKERRQRVKDALSRHRAIQAAAKAQLAAKRYVEAVQASRFFAAERRAQQQAEAAIRSGRYQEALQFKDQQLLNHALAMESLRIKAEADKTIKYFEKFTKRGGKKLSIDPAYLEQIDDLLERFDFKKAGAKALAKRQSLREWIIEHEAAMEVVTIPDQLRDEAFRVHYSDLSIEELRDLEDSVRNIEHLGRLKNKLLTAKNKREFEAAVADVEAAIYQNNKVKPQSLDPNEEGLQKWLARMRSAHAQLSKIEFIVRQLDGHKDLGTAWYYLFRPIIEAEEQEIALRKAAEGQLKELFSGISPAERAAWKSRKIFIKDINLSLTKENIISLALNWGNEGNRQRIMSGFGWSQQTVEKILDDHMTKRDWDLVQGIWDYINSYYPEIDQLTKDVAGVKLPKVEAAPVITQFGDYAGGYYPIKYDARKSEAAFAFDEVERQRSFFENQFFRAATKKGHTKDRAAQVVGRPLRLDLGVLSEHLTNVIHDLAFRRAVRDVDKMIRHKRIQDAIVNTLGREVYRQFNPWLQAIANDYSAPANYLEGLAAKARKGTTVVAMGWKITTALAQPVGAFNFMDRIGAGRTLAALSGFYAKPWTWKEQIDFVFEKSVFMRTRISNYDRDVRQTIDQLIKENAWDRVKETFFWHIGFMDLSISVPVWIDEYNKVKEETGDDERALRAADALIRQTQGSGMVKDLAAIQRGPEMQKLFTMFYSYFSALYNLFASRLQQTKGTSDIPRLIAGAAYLWFFPALLSELVTGRGPGDDDNDDEKLKWLYKTIVAYPFQAIPGIRDAVSSLTSGYDYRMSPAADAVETFIRAGWAGAKLLETGSDEDQAKFGKRSAEAVSYFTGLPAKQLIITLGAMYDYIVEDADVDIRDALLGKKKKN